jgi:hypothetical protein
MQWRRSAIAAAVGLMVISGASYGQSNTTGNIFGQVTAAAGTTVVIENTATGVKRTLTPDSSGRFTANSMPTGSYKAVLMVNGKVVGTADNIEVTVSQSREVLFSSSATQTVQVVGKVAQIDVSSSTNGSTFTAKQLAALPVARNIDAIIQLAPNTTRADPRYAGGATIAGGAPSENSYYINGFPVTNPLTQLGSMELPFGAIANADILAGGFGAEFGRSTGGVVNIVTKSGGNTWEGGVSASVTPNSLRGNYKDIYFPKTGAVSNAETDGTLFRLRKDNTLNEYSLGASIGGPLIKDQLFMFVAVERLGNQYNHVLSNSETAHSSGGWAEQKNVNDRYLAKFDWNLTNDHHLELTLVGDKYKQDEKLYGFDYSTLKHDNVLSAVDKYVNVPNQTDGDGGSAQVLKYTGYLTDDLTVTLLGGKMTSPHSNKFSAASGFGGPQVFVNSGANYPGLNYTIPYPFLPNSQSLPAGAKDTVDALRFDLEYHLGDHSIRGGVDSVSLKSKNAGATLIGDSYISYSRTSSGGAVFGPVGPTQQSLANAGALSETHMVNGNPVTYYYYGRERIFNDATSAGSDQAAQYIEDKWQMTKDFSVTGGLRNETYKNKNGDGQTFLKMDNQINPRLAFAWDALGDSSTAVYGTLGRYAVQIPTHLAVRGASRSTLTNEYFVYTGVDANGQPTGRKNISEVFSPDGEFGQAKDPNTVAARHLKPNSQDELTLGIKKALSSDLTVGGDVIYRRLNSTIDDFCDDRPFQRYAIANGIQYTTPDGTKENYGPIYVIDPETQKPVLDHINSTGFSCASMNPGKANDFLVDYTQKGGANGYTQVHLTAADMGFGAAKRTYAALNMFAEHPLKDGWWGKVTYTLSRSKGNTEGQTLSDVAQTDVSATQTWDYPELMEHAYGPLPGDRKHQIKLFGLYQATPEFDIGANLLLASGRPKNCIGNYAGASNDPGYPNPDYGAATHYCTTSITYDAQGNVTAYTTAPSPRGSAGNLPWDKRLDMNFTYKPEAIKGLGLRVDVFNVFNTQVAQAVDELHEADYDPTSISPTYGRVISYTAPRSIKLTAMYDFKF